MVVIKDKKEHELLEIIDSSTEGSFIHDLVKGEIYYSSVWKKRPGIEHLTPQEATLVSATHVHPEDWHAIQKTYLQACEHKAAKVKMEFRVKTVDSGYIWVLGQGKIIYNQDGKPVKYYGTHIDITKWKKTEEDLQRYAEELKQKEDESLQLIDGFAEGSWIVDRLAGTIKCSEKWAKRIGLDQVPEEERMAYTQTLTHPDDMAGGNSIPHHIELGAERFDLEYRRYIWTQTKGKIAYNGQGEAVKVYAATIDITERKKLEDTLRQADQNKNDFLSTLSHELRNPLAAIMMSLALLNRATPGGEQARKAIDIMERQTTQLSHLIDDLLDITRITRNKIQLKKERVEINRLILTVIKDYQAQYEEKDVKLEVELSTDPLLLEADPIRLTQVIGNLLHNAVKFTDKGGRVIIAVAEDIERRCAIVTVQDNGMGIKPEILPLLFQPFMQVDKSLDRNRGGLGLGLAIVKGMVELHGGSVEVYSEGLGRGTKFTLCLPLLELVEPDQDKQPEDKGQISSSLRILVIDDIPDLAESLCALLCCLGHEVMVAYNGIEGLTKAKEHRPEVIFCDIGLPGMNGYEVGRNIRADDELRDTFLIALTGYALPEDLDKAMEAGFQRHLAKPVDITKLKLTLADAVMKR